MNNTLKSNINDLPSISSVIKEYDLSAKKKLSQNFLLDLNLTNKIISLSGNLKNKQVIEIGPGPGSLTRSILSNYPQKVIVIEKDKRFIKALEDLKKISESKLIIICEDVLKVDFKNLINEFKLKEVFIISNLPYSIGTKLLLNLLPIPSQIKQLTLMFQREVAERIVAKAGTKKYGRISVLVGLLTDAKILMHIPSKAFKPIPKVNSSVIVFKKKQNKEILFDINVLEDITKILFKHKRKQVKSSLKYFGDPISLCKKMNISPSIRPEQISLESYEKLAIEITNHRLLQI